MQPNTKSTTAQMGKKARGVGRLIRLLCSLVIGVNEFYKKGCQEKSSPSTGGREDFSLEIQPTDCKYPPIALERFGSGLFALPVGFIFRW